MTGHGNALSGKVAVIFGIDDIGRGISLRFAREGATLALIDVDSGRARALAREMAPEVWAGSADASSDAAIASAIDAAAIALGRLDVLVINVLPSPVIASLEHQESAAFDAAFRAVAAIRTAMQAGFRHMQRAGGGRIVNVGHRYGEGVNEGIGAYNTAAWALVGLTRTAAVDWGRCQIATNLLLPLADTSEFRAYHQRKPKVLDVMTSQLALARIGDPIEDIGGAALFLASDATNFVNGEIVHADGGQHIAAPVLSPGKFK
jgi:NAD(P)-dependent dehydrogenase (short-subunit alcohol dehydrogenase family)